MPVIVAAAPEIARVDVPISQQEGALDHDAPDDNSSSVSEVDDASNSSDDS